MKRHLIFAGIVVAAASAAWALQSGMKLYVGGKLASSGVIERNGVAYVPLKDVASAMGLGLTKTARGYEMSAPGGANQVEGLNGKVGEVLFNGYFRMQVTEVIRAKEYTNRFSGDNQKITGYPEGNDLVVLICRIKNGTKEKLTVFLPGGDYMALTDDQGRSYGPRTGLSIDCPSRGADLLPGAAVDFALTYDVPADAKIKDLVYGVYSTGPVASRDKKFRISLSQ